MEIEDWDSDSDTTKNILRDLWRDFNIDQMCDNL